VIRVKEEFYIFCMSIWFLTRIPLPNFINYREEWLEKSARYHSLAGIGIGSLIFLAYYLIQFIMPISSAYFFALGFGVFLTGAFHEDGFLVFCDGIGGGWNQTDILRIMKDSRVGSFAVMGGIFLIGAKWLGGSYSLQKIQTSSYPNLLAWLYFSVVHSMSRFLSSSFLYFGRYAREEGKSKPMANQMRFSDILISICFCFFPLIPCLYISPAFGIVFLPLALVRYYMENLMDKWIGGYTGDALGAVQQASEIVLYSGGFLLCLSI